MNINKCCIFFIVFLDKKPIYPHFYSKNVSFSISISLNDDDDSQCQIIYFFNID